MDKTENLYSFEIKPALENEFSYSWAMMVMDKAVIQAQGGLLNWEYIDNVLDLLSFVFS